jgi:exopolysaccharide biosynthesis polyprenyl glycosylphosphotransferase
LKKRTFLTNLNKLGMILVDILVVWFSIYISYMFKFNFNPPKFNYDAFIVTTPFIVIIYLIFMYVFGLLDVIQQSVYEIVYSVFLSVVMLLISTTAITFFLRAFSYPRTVILISAVLQFVFLSIWRLIVWKLHKKMYGKKSVLIIGNSSTEHVTRKILLKQSDIYDIKYICDQASKDVLKYISLVDIVIICDDLEPEYKNHVLDFCLFEQRTVFLVPNMSDMALLGSKLNNVDDLPLLEIKPLSLTIEQKIVKRILDLIIAVIGLIILSPILLIVSLLIKLSDGGKIFYSQERITDDAKIFKVLKFRSMVVNAEKLSGPVLASEDDPRVTKIGRFIRATRIDELPQIINILKGEMSVVGPRPERPYYVNKFTKEISDYKYRTLVRAGLTGLAQVLGKYNTMPEDKVRYDIMYIKNYSILLDIKLIFQTIKIIFIKESTEGVKDQISVDKLIEKSDCDIEIDKKVE